MVCALGGAYVVVIMAEWTVHSRSIRTLGASSQVVTLAGFAMFFIPLAAPWIIDGWRWKAERRPSVCC